MIAPRRNRINWGPVWGVIALLVAWVVVVLIGVLTHRLVRVWDA